MSSCASNRRRLLLAALLGPTYRSAWSSEVLASWRSDFDQEFRDWPGEGRGWGVENREFLRLQTPSAATVLRVHIRKGSIDPASMARRGEPRSGTGFRSAVLPAGADAARLSYWVRFPEGFDFVRGGKLPGLYGGRGNSGGEIPDGSNGFSLRLMWREAGAAEVYAYLPTSERHGTSLLRGRFAFVPGRWHHVVQEVVLNRPGHDDGVVSMVLDGQFAGAANGLRMRDVASLRIDGIFFDLFFGGSDPTWAAAADTYVDFSQFAVQALPGHAVR
jgi:hypothetical protein